MRMKKLIALLMALAMIFALAACGGDTTPSQAPASQDPGATTSDEGGEPTGEPVTITVASFNIGDFKDSSAWDPIIEAFNAKYPNITVEIQSVTYQDGDH